MSLADELDEIGPDARGDAVARALGRLSHEDCAAWLGALDSGDYKHTTLARLLNQYAHSSVTGRQVGHFKEKRGAWQY
ncbi:hypothetical protein Q7C18_02670 [Nesterenkonia sp. CL21]|uniref:hypothetical protein n=1 Tax=Nesterenkonia sp. CL21 TaxID=3064894 RepID=UPI0028791C4A|nr:hypothetical protein [Nesterenkonia sp. CL21]MDS2171592.1 hypothetical protein [Nesterenkonia sp. CL21]